MNIVGSSYTDGLGVLRIVALSSFFVAFTWNYISVLRVRKNIRLLVLVSGVFFLLPILFTYSLVPRFGLSSAGYPWLVSYGVSSLLILAVSITQRRQGDS